MKRTLCILLAILLLTGMFAGCGSADSGSVFKADNEIFTYQKIDPEKTQIVVSRTGNIPVEELCTKFVALNPDIQIIYLDITGGNSGYKPLIEWIKNGYLPDVVVSAADFFDEELTEQYFENLSDDPIIQNYEADALQRTSTNANVYWLPGPSNISAMMYNKTLFKKYGWEIPNTFDEFVSLCDRIRKDTKGEVEPWNPNAKYGNELITAIEAFTYEELFGGLENRTWYNDFNSGKGTFTGHMEPYTEVLQTLIDHGILLKEHFTYSATTRGKEFAAGKIAMINMNIYDADTDEFDFGFMPFPTTKGEIGYLCDSYSCYVGLPVKKHTAKQEKAIERFIAYFSSPEGQRAYIGKSMKVSNVKDMPLNQSDDLAELQPAVEAGHMFGMLEFQNGENGYSRVNLHSFAVDMTDGSATGAECIARTDARQNAAQTKPDAAQPEVVASSPDGLTILETSFLIADAYREAADADVGLIANNAAYRGNLMLIFAGDITNDIISVLKPRSFSNGSTLVKVSMTGEQLIGALNAPLGYDKIADCIYAYSGLRCEVAPWNALGAKYLSVSLADGSALEPDRLYTVALWAGTLADEYVTETLETYEGTWEELMTAKLKADGTAVPADDGRIKLVWD